MHACFKECGVIDTKKEVVYVRMYSCLPPLYQSIIMKLTNLLFVKGSQ